MKAVITEVLGKGPFTVAVSFDDGVEKPYGQVYKVTTLEELITLAQLEAERRQTSMDSEASIKAAIGQVLDLTPTDAP